MNSQILRAILASGLLASSSLAFPAPASLLADYQSKSFTTSGFDGITGISGEQQYSYGVLRATGPGTITYTYLGSEAKGVDTFWGFSGFDQFVNKDVQVGLLGIPLLTVPHTAVGTTFIQPVYGAGYLYFGMSSYSNGVAYVVNGMSFKDFSGNFSTRGVFGISPGRSVNGSQYDYLVLFNDRGKDADFDDLVVGVKFAAAVPEPETYSMMVAGLGMLGMVARRRRKAAANDNRR